MFSGKKVMYALLLIIICLDIFGSNAQLLPEDEVQALRTIFRNLNQTVKIKRTSCSDGNWNFKAGSVTSNITCDCTLNASSICRVTNIALEGHGGEMYNPFVIGGSSSFLIRDMLEMESEMCNRSFLIRDTLEMESEMCIYRDHIISPDHMISPVMVRIYCVNITRSYDISSYG